LKKLEEKLKDNQKDHTSKKEHKMNIKRVYNKLFKKMTDV